MAKYKDLTLGQIEAVVNKMGGAEIALAYLRGEYEFTALKKTEAAVVFSAPVNRTRTPMEAFKSTGRVQYVDEAVAVAMPLCAGDHVEMMFVNLGSSVACNKLDEELAKMGLELIVDPIGLTAINEAHPAFADTYPNGTQWKDANGNYCCALFARWRVGRYVDVDQDAREWSDYWWFPVRRK